MKKIAALLFLFLSFSCDDSMPAQTRSFQMGFSPWLYEASLEAREWVYHKLETEGDIISHHLEEGVPWAEALNNEPYAETFQDELTFRKSKRVAGQTVLVQINPLNIERNGLARYRGDAVNMALPSPWDTYALNSAPVKTAYLNYARYIVDFLQPDYLSIGVEANLLIRNNPTLWPAFVELHRHVYNALKQDYPNLPISVSMFCVPYFPQWSPEDDLDAQLEGLDDLQGYYDILSFSVHPFMSALLAETFPDNYFEELFAVTDKPVAISESSYPAQTWSTATPPVLTFNGSEQKQNDFLQKMLAAANSADAEFVIWFTIRDYDVLWNNELGKSGTALIWRDTGIYDEAGVARLAHESWTEWFNKTRR